MLGRGRRHDERSRQSGPSGEPVGAPSRWPALTFPAAAKTLEVATSRSTFYLANKLNLRARFARLNSSLVVFYKVQSGGGNGGITWHWHMTLAGLKGLGAFVLACLGVIIN